MSLKIPVGLETTTVKSTLVGEYFSSISVGVNLKLTNFGFSSSAPLAAGGVLTKTSAITHAMLVNIFFYGYTKETPSSLREESWQ